MKKRFAAFALVFAITVAFLALPSSKGFAQYNDSKYDTYKNMNNDAEQMHARYIVPNLYRQDASYTNVKSFPLVVSEGVEYFPLEIFAMYPYIEVVYSKIAYGFYVNNTNNNKYIAFNLDDGTTTTNDSQKLDVRTNIFYSAYYLPAKAVCEAIGLKFESYDNAEDGIHAARISDNNAKYTLSELIALYSPKSNVVQKPEEDAPKIPDVVPTPTPENGSTPVNEQAGESEAVADPYTKIAARNIYLTFENCPDRNTEKVLDVLKNYEKKATFFVSSDKVFADPSAVRRIITDGHTLGLYVSPTDENGNIRKSDDMIKLLDDANNALYTVTKRKVRFVRVSGGSGTLKANGFADAATENGYVLFDWTCDSADYYGRVQNSYDSLVAQICGGPAYRKTEFVRFGSYGATCAVVSKLADFCNKYRQFKILASDEFTEVPSF